MNPERSDKIVNKSSRLKNVGHITFAGAALAAIMASSECMDDGVREMSSSEDFHDSSIVADAPQNLYLAAYYPETFCELDVGSGVYFAVSKPVIHPGTGAATVCEDFPPGELGPVFANELGVNSTPTPIPNP